MLIKKTKRNEGNIGTKKVTSAKREELTCSNRILEADIEIALDNPKFFSTNRDCHTN